MCIDDSSLQDNFYIIQIDEFKNSLMNECYL